MSSWKLRWRACLSWLLSSLLPETALEKELADMNAEKFCLRVGYCGMQRHFIVVGTNADGRPQKIPVFRMFNYKEQLIQEAIWLLKYQGNRQAARIFGECLRALIGRIVSEEKSFSHFREALIVPIPLSSERKKERGWNQTEMIAGEIIKSARRNSGLNLVFCEALVKNRPTLPQTHLSRTERLTNLKDCFTLNNPLAIKDKNIIIIDDVTTTGATLAEAASTLQRAGIKNIIALTAAS